MFEFLGFRLVGFIYIVFISIFLLCLSVSVIFASGFSLEVLSAPDDLDLDEEGDVTASFSGDPKYYAQKSYYLRAVFYKEGSDDYFGFTKNNIGDWITNTNDKSKYFQFTTSSEATWSGEIKIKNDLFSPYFTGTDSYQFKIGRYTSSGDTSADWSSPVFINLMGPTPTPQPSTVPTATINAISNPSPTPTKSPTPKPTVRPTTKPSTPPGETPLVLSAATTTSPSPEVLISSEKKSSFPAIAFLFIGLGALCLGVAFYPFLKAKIKGYNNSDAQID